MMLLNGIFLALLVSAMPLFAQRSLALAPKSDAAEPGFDPARLQRLDTVIQEHVDRKQIAGAIVFIARDGQQAHLRTFGLQDIEAARPMAPDAIFRIASMSKAVTSVAVMMLYEEGKFRLHDPVSKFIPGFAKSVVAIKPSETTPAAAGKTYATVPAKRPIRFATC
jgi:CubicO group peptidase (beta-lactamase class C family)